MGCRHSFPLTPYNYNITFESIDVCVAFVLGSSPLISSSKMQGVRPRISCCQGWVSRFPDDNVSLAVFIKRRCQPVGSTCAQGSSESKVVVGPKRGVLFLSQRWLTSPVISLVFAKLILVFGVDQRGVVQSWRGSAWFIMPR